MTGSQPNKAGREDGFTLVELLVVIVILGILAAIVVFAVGGITDKGSSSAKAADRRAVEVAEEAFFAKTTSTPVYASESDLVSGTLLRSPSTLHDVCLSDNTDPDGPGPLLAITAARQYQVVDAGAGCDPGFSLAP